MDKEYLKTLIVMRLLGSEAILPACPVLGAEGKRCFHCFNLTNGCLQSGC